ncbi:hypothetical protein ACOHYD_09035 [Desulfobacterota bacterium M19]
MKKLFEIPGNILLEQLAQGKNLVVSDNDLLAIKLRSRVFFPDSEAVKKNPLCLATSAELGKNGRKVFWLLTGGLMESNIDLSHKKELGGIPVRLGFEAHAFLDYHSFQPYTKKFPETINSVLENLTVELPLDAERAGRLLPGASFQLIGKANTKLSAGLRYTRGLNSATFSVGGGEAGEFALRISRGGKNMVSVSISQILGRSINSVVTGSLGWAVGIGEVLNHKWFSEGKSLLNSLDLDYITGSLPDWDSNIKFGDYLAGKGQKTIGKFLKNYSSFYASLGRMTSQNTKNLVKFIINLGTDSGRKAYDCLCHFDEEKAAGLAKGAGSGVERIALQDNTNIDKTSAEAGFPGKKVLLSHTLRSVREGFLAYDNHIQIMELLVRNKKTVFFNNNQEITWEGFEVQVDDQNRGRDYWRFFFRRQDSVTSMEEIVRFSRFASLLGDIPSLAADDIKRQSWFTKLFTTKDNTDFQVDVYFTEAGLRKLVHATKNDIRQAIFQCAEVMGNISPGVMVEDRNVRRLLKDYLELGLEYDDDGVREKIIEGYREINGRGLKEIRADALTLRKAAIFIDYVSMMRGQEISEWNDIFLKLGKETGNDFMVIIAAVCKLAGKDDTFVSSLEIKRHDSGVVLLTAGEDGKIITGEEMFNDAQKAVINAKA